MFDQADSRHSSESSAEDLRLLFHNDSGATGAVANDMTRQSLSTWKDYSSNMFAKFSLLFPRYLRRLNLRVLAMGFVLISLALIPFSIGGQQSITNILPFTEQTTSSRPFSGAFARFPRLSALSSNQRRMTVVGIWNDDAFPSYLRHFFYTAQLNADVLDVLIINRRRKTGGQCLNFDKAGVDITWGGNIKHYCLDDAEWNRRHVNFLCSEEFGWNCTSTEYESVMQEWKGRSDKKNGKWKTLRGWVFRDLFLHPELPFWGWMDQDLFVGDLRRYPFNILSQLSFLTGSQSQAEHLYMAGQFSTFNFDDPMLASAWKKFPSLKSPAHFTNYTEGKMPESTEEKYWSFGYMRSDADLPGHDLSWAIYPDLHGDDYFEGEWFRKNSSETYVVSGRDILLVPTAYDRKAIEALIKFERQVPVNDLGGIGWTTGEDGSAYLVERPSLTSEQAKALAMGEKRGASTPHEGIVEDLVIVPNCNYGPELGEDAWRQCLPLHPLSTTSPPVMRSSLVHFKEQRAGHVLRRLEKDDRLRGYERKLVRHNLKSKRMSWLQWPNFDITEDLVMMNNLDSLEVWKMGDSRDDTIFRRREGTKDIG